MLKHKKDVNRLLHLHPLSLVILFQMNLYCFNKGLRFQVTSTVSTKSEDEAVNRVSATHREGRAFDVSIKNWSPYDIEEFKNHFDLMYGSYGAVSYGGERNLIVDHIGTARHLHVQIDRSYTIKEPLAE